MAKDQLPLKSSCVKSNNTDNIRANVTMRRVSITTVAVEKQ